MSYIDYNGTVKVHSSLLTVVLRDGRLTGTHRHIGNLAARVTFT